MIKYVNMDDAFLMVTINLFEQKQSKERMLNIGKILLS